MLILLFLLLIVSSASAQQQPRFVPEDHRPPLFLREGWKNPNGTGATCADCDPKVQVNIRPDLVENPNLELKTYGPGKNEVQVVHHDSPKDDPSFIWTGMTKGNWVVALRDKNNYADLTGFASDPVDVDADDLLELPVTLCVVDGTVRHRAEV